ncbi:MAG: hypothetical protein J0H74_15210 [Chitinophagaceae bacterium]|nr:hypothetical protein [Chitinophagaceae bacterium]
MTALIAYIIKSIVTCGALYAYYQLALRNKKIHAYNRCYLLAAVVVSLTLPFANLNLYAVESFASRPAAAHPGPFVPAGHIFYWCIGSLSFVLLVVMFSKIAWIYKIKRKGGYIKLGHIHFVETGHETAPFSFLNNLFWKEGMPRDDEQGEKIFIHEMTHIRQKHTYDKLFIQIVTCIWWMNPFYWLIQKELNIVHEFMADAACIEEGDTGSFAMMLLRSHNDGRYLNPSHHFFNSPVIRRLNMVAASNHTTHKFGRKLLALPLIVLLLVLFSYKSIAVKDGTPTIEQLEREQKLQDEKKAQEGSKAATTWAAHTYFIRYRYWTFM